MQAAVTFALCSVLAAPLPLPPPPPPRPLVLPAPGPAKVREELPSGVRMTFYFLSGGVLAVGGGVASFWGSMGVANRGFQPIAAEHVVLIGLGVGAVVTAIVFFVLGTRLNSERHRIMGEGGS